MEHYNPKLYDATSPERDTFLAIFEGHLGKDEVEYELELQEKILSKSQRNYMSVASIRLLREYKFKDYATPFVKDAQTLMGTQKDYVGFFKACGPAYISG